MPFVFLVITLDTLSKFLILISLFLVSAGAILGGLIFLPGQQLEATNNSQQQAFSINNKNVDEYFNIPQPASQIQQPKEAVLMFTGDMMLSRRVGAKTAKQGNWRWPFLQIGDYLSQADLTIGNLESVISDQGHNVGSIYSFRADPRMLEGLTFAGFDVLDPANNHVGDWTRLAFEDSTARLTNAGISNCGAGANFDEAHTAVVRQAGSAKIGFLCYTDIAAAPLFAKENQSGVANMDLTQLKKDIESAKQNVDIIVVQMHTGVEYQPHPNSKQKTFAKTAIDAGANLVVGHHPHVIQDFEQYKNGWIAYSLGNFIFDQDFSVETRHGQILKVTLRDKTIESVDLIDVYDSLNFQVSLSKD
ncbi:MAG: hypothetical protein COS76_03360 [Candidatus Portnoybacteria bacterium CG06_land_8_20_14_3_00_39_12]|uniref:Capsule synthesis protein CapA domain-containing protein n=2 Tax=Candidatus Portnoyibacteriota TaxID=1817913 RepID=A0A2M7UIE0_9BACT|nr:MAG: hypothetical protein COS76_03360 [Candidatus Portnoybacteria bacterium CG06_land_8_20_14_3_00_39_12]PIZ70977.1 MAG: hypothetical protein COY09_01760 [Candidatus Portnoybacteria bacterium CG_4_10_14_0_2_um_filter_39_11]